MSKAVSTERFYQLFILILSILLLWQWQCKKTSPCPKVTQTVKIDTVDHYRVDSVKITGPVPVAVKPGKPRIIRPDQDPANPSPSDYLPFVDTAAIIKDYFAQREYDTTYAFPEASVRVRNTLSGNRILVQKLDPTFHTQTITKTITNTVIDKKRNQFYLGIEAVGGPNDPLYGAGASLMLKTKKDRVYEIGPVIYKNQPVMLRAGIKFLLSFRK